MPQPHGIAGYSREVMELTWYFGERFGETEADKQSAQSRWQAEIEARSKMARHRPFFMYYGGAPHQHKGTDLRCGCEVHPDGDEGGLKERPSINIHALHAVRDETPVAHALAYADESAPYLREPESPPWTCAAPPSKVLELRFYWPQPAELAVFDPAAAARVTNTLQMRGSRKPLERQRVELAAQAATRKEERGPGNLAVLTTTADSMFGKSSPVRVRALGRRLARPPASVQDRYLQREIAAECEALELLALAVYRRSRSRIPDQVRRRARAIG